MDEMNLFPELLDKLHMTQFFIKIVPSKNPLFFLAFNRVKMGCQICKHFKNRSAFFRASVNIDFRFSLNACVYPVSLAEKNQNVLVNI